MWLPFTAQTFLAQAVWASVHEKHKSCEQHYYIFCPCCGMLLSLNSFVHPWHEYKGRLRPSLGSSEENTKLPWEQEIHGIHSNQTLCVGSFVTHVHCSVRNTLRLFCLRGTLSASRTRQISNKKEGHLRWWVFCLCKWGLFFISHYVILDQGM